MTGFQEANGAPPFLLLLCTGNRRLTARAEYVAKYATKDAADEAGDDSESDDSMSSVGSFESGDEEPAGQMDEV